MTESPDVTVSVVDIACGLGALAVVVGGTVATGSVVALLHDVPTRLVGSAVTGLLLLGLAGLLVLAALLLFATLRLWMLTDEPSS